MHILAQWQNLALSICEVYREKKRMHLLDPKAEPHMGGMTFLGRGRAKSSPSSPGDWPMLRWHGSGRRQPAEDYLVGRILCFGLKEAKFNHLFGRL